MCTEVGVVDDILFIEDGLMGVFEVEEAEALGVEDFGVALFAEEDAFVVGFFLAVDVLGVEDLEATGLAHSAKELN